MYAIDARRLSKFYGKVAALEDINIKVAQGKTFGLLGPNGAGKTTFVKSLLGLVHFQEGELLLQERPARDKYARKNIGYLPEKFHFYPFETVEGVLRFYGKIHALKGHELKYQVEKALLQLDIETLSKRKIKTLSKGQLQRLGVASLLMGDNKLLILDEPFSGLDPIGIKDLKELIKTLKTKAITILINSHILTEVELLCDEFAILNQGKCLFTGTMDEVKNRGINLEDFFYQLVQRKGVV